MKKQSRKRKSRSNLSTNRLFRTLHGWAHRSEGTTLNYACRAMRHSQVKDDPASTTTYAPHVLKNCRRYMRTLSVTAHLRLFAEYGLRTEGWQYLIS